MCKYVTINMESLLKIFYFLNHSSFCLNLLLTVILKLNMILNFHHAAVVQNCIDNCFLTIFYWKCNGFVINGNYFVWE